MSRIGIFPGSFNPFHKGHLELVKILFNENLIDELFIVPTVDYWDKKNLVDQQIRGRFILDTIDDQGINISNRIHVSIYKDQYTYNIIERIKHDNGEDKDYYLIIGADNVKDFDKWVEYKKIIEENNIIIFGRNNELADFSIFEDKAQFIPFNYNLSSTEVREDIKYGIYIIHGIDYRSVVDNYRNVEKTAKEMFEDLGFELTEEVIKLSDSYTEKFYHYKSYLDSGNVDNIITFVSPRNKIFMLYPSLTIDFKTLEAINKQAKEIGWLE